MRFGSAQKADAGAKEVTMVSDGIWLQGLLLMYFHVLVPAKKGSPGIWETACFRDHLRLLARGEAFRQLLSYQ